MARRGTIARAKKRFAEIRLELVARLIKLSIPPQDFGRRVGIQPATFRKIASGSYDYPSVLSKLAHNAELDVREALEIVAVCNYVLEGGVINPYASKLEPPSCWGLQYPVREFVGRREILTRLETFLTGSDKTTFCLYGPQGIGKSEIVRKFLSEMFERQALRLLFPDGSAYVNRHAAGTQIQQLKRTQTIILQSVLGLRYTPPHHDADEAIAAQYLKELAGKRLLLVVDNVANLAEAEALTAWLTPGGGKCILLSMEQFVRRPDWDGMVVSAFTSEEAEQYLAHSFPTVARKVMEDVRLHHNRPKYLWKLACYHAAPEEHQCRDSAESFRMIQADPNERRHIQGLEPELERELCALAICSGSFGAEQAGHILGRSPADARIRLLRFARLSWICHDSMDLFSFHAIERHQLAAVRDLSTELRARTGYGHYLRSQLAEMERRFQLGGENVGAALRGFNRFRDDLLETVDFLVNRGGGSREAGAACRQLIAAAPNVMFVMVPCSRLSVWGRQIVRAPGYEGDDRCQFVAHWFQWLFSYLREDLEAALQHAEEMKRLAVRLAEKELLLEALWDYGHAWVQQQRKLLGKISDPIPVPGCFAEARGHFRGLEENQRVRCQFYFHLGWAQMYALELEPALASFDEALMAAKVAQDSYAEGRIMINRSRVYRKMGKIQIALGVGADAHDFALRKQTSNVLQALSNRNMSRIYEELGDFQKARHFEEQWREWKDNTEHPHSKESEAKVSTFAFAEWGIAAIPAVDAALIEDRARGLWPELQAATRALLVAGAARRPLST